MSWDAEMYEWSSKAQSGMGQGAAATSDSFELKLFIVVWDDTDDTETRKTQGGVSWEWEWGELVIGLWMRTGDAFLWGSLWSTRVARRVQRALTVSTNQQTTPASTRRATV